MDAQTNQNLLSMAEDFEARALQVERASLEAARTQVDMLQNTLKLVYPLADDMAFGDLIRALDDPSQERAR